MTSCFHLAGKRRHRGSNVPQLRGARKAIFMTGVIYAPIFGVMKKGRVYTKNKYKYKTQKKI
jgi:hypothetical protein